MSEDQYKLLFKLIPCMKINFNLLGYLFGFSMIKKQQTD